MIRKTSIRPGGNPDAKDSVSSSAETNSNPSANENHAAPADGTATISIADLLNRAKVNIEAGEDRFRQAAEDIATASEQGATQHQIAETVGKSQAWVNGLLKWRSAGYQDTPFGPQSKASRARRADYQAPNNHRPASTSEQAEAVKAKAEAATARARAQQAKAEAAEARAQARKAKAEANKASHDTFTEMHRRSTRPKEIHSSMRTLLIKALGMLGSEQDGECLNAARKAEQLRKKLGMNWDELIVEATEQQQAAA